MKRKVAVFSGQGSQFYHMGANLYSSNSTFHEWVQRGSEVVQKRWGISLVEKLYDSTVTKGEVIHDFFVSHPSLFVVQHAAYQALIEAEGQFDLVMGYSLGEFVALAASGCWQYDRALHHICDQVDWISSSCQRGGLLVALAEKESISKHLSAYEGQYAIAMSARYDNYTLSSPEGVLEPIKAKLEEAGITVIRLPVAYPFHSKWIDRAKAPLKKRVIPFSVRAPFVALGKQPGQVDSEYLWNVIQRPIDLEEGLSIHLMSDDLLFDCSPMGSIQALAKGKVAKRIVWLK